MKTAIDKAEHWLNDNVHGWTKGQFRALVVLLKEQDRDTRHACADAVNRIALDDKAISAAHNACMNVTAV